jgi:hypothetical protein
MTAAGKGQGGVKLRVQNSGVQLRIQDKRV